MNINIPTDYSIPQLAGLLKDMLPTSSAKMFPLGDFWLFFGLIIVFYLTYKIIFPKGKRFAIKLLAKSEFEKVKTKISQQNNFESLKDLSDLLRRVGISVFGNEAVADLHSGAWVNFILEHDKNNSITQESAQILAQAPYSDEKTATDVDINEIYKQAYDWSMTQL